jgi:catalase
VGAIVAGVGVAFGYIGGWLTPPALTPPRFIDTFQKIDGVYPGFRRNHAKGVCVSGYFDSTGQAARWSRAAVFQPGRVQVEGRFALAGGLPYASDTPQTVRSLALRFSLPDGEEWRTGMINIPVFPANTPAVFHEQLIAMAPDPATGKPDPVKAQAFLEQNPASARAIASIRAQKIASGFENSAYNALNAFELVDAAGRATPVRWSVVPLQPFVEAAPQAPADAPNYLFDALIARIHEQPLRWRLIVTIGQPGDPTDDATIAWPAERELVEAGTLTLDGIESEDTSPVRTVNFDPLILPDGISPSDDPLLSARSAAYSVSFTRRVGEPASPSAVSPQEVSR